MCWVINNVQLESLELHRGGDLAHPSVFSNRNSLSEDAHEIRGEVSEFISQMDGQPSSK